MISNLDCEAKPAQFLNLEDLLHSDFLPRLVRLVDALPDLKPLLPRLLQLRLVVDANRVQGELRWRVRRRRNPANRSSLHEAIDAGVVVLFAPLYVKWEIEKHYENIAAETGTTIGEVKQEWALFQKCLCFHAPKTQPLATETYADINDFPYLATWIELDTQAIYTADPHLARMGAPVVSVSIDKQLRDYARGSTVQIAVAIGSSFSMVVGWEFLRVVYQLLVRCIKAIRQLPLPVQVGLAAAGVICVAHPKGRPKVKEGWNAFKNSEAALTLCDAIVDFVAQVTEAAQKAKVSHENLQAALPARQKRPLLMHARSVCIAARSALTLEELERRILRGGYVTHSQTFQQYLRRVLRTDDSFKEVRPGRWSIHAPANQG